MEILIALLFVGAVLWSFMYLCIVVAFVAWKLADFTVWSLRRLCGKKT